MIIYLLTYKFLGCLNTFVQVEVDTSEIECSYTITCVFLNQLDATVKSCSVTYGPCQQETTKNVTSDPTDGDTVSVMVQELENCNSSTRALCYTVTATNGSYTIEVEGRFGEYIAINM